ncbi:MAG: hypothetical protein ABIV43_01855 [Candidatus Saccharimonadales bacterium]
MKTYTTNPTSETLTPESLSGIYSRLQIIDKLAAQTTAALANQHPRLLESVTVRDNVQPSAEVQAQELVDQTGAFMQGVAETSINRTMGDAARQAIDEIHGARV